MRKPMMGPTREAAPARGRRRSLRLAIGLAALSAALLAPGAALATEPAPTADTCDGHWPASVQGKPTMYGSGARAGDYLWHDAKGWHLRVTKVSSSKAVFTGRVRSDRPMTVRGVALEKGDSFTLSADKLTLTYRFANYGHVDGVDFTTACADRLAFGGSMNGEKLPTGRIWIGRNGRHPLQNPFAVHRVD